MLPQLWEKILFWGRVGGGEGQEADIENFFVSLDLKNKNKMPEVKFGHLTQKETDLLKKLEKPNVHLMLDWLIYNKVDIHYTTLNNLYYILIKYGAWGNMFYADPLIVILQWVKNKIKKRKKEWM